MAEKQDKVLNKIKRSIEGLDSPSTNLGKKNNDECYTSMQDILNELAYWGGLGKFEGKNIICPCDWDIVEGENIYSITIDFLDEDVKVNKNIVKNIRVKYTFWDRLSKIKPDGSIMTNVELKENEIEDFLRNKLTCNFIRTLVQNARRWGIKSVTASGYNPETGEGIKFQDVDYSKYDICITNPPFSLYADFMKAIVGKIDFIVLAPLMNRANPSVGLNLMLKKAYLGLGIDMHMNFVNPNKENKYNTKVVNCDWITSFPEAQEERNNNNYKTRISYELYKDEYLIMDGITMKDGTHPIKVTISTYPDDYDGWMFGSVGILDKLNQNEYEWYGTGFKKYYNQDNPEANPFNHKVTNEMVKGNGKQMFHGIVFRKRRIN